MFRRHLLSAASVLLMAALPAVQAQAQTYPAKPITLVVPYSAGGATDTLARTIADKLQARLGQTVLVDNRPGASTVIATNFVRQAAPDGYTLYLTTSQIGQMPLISPSTAKYDPINDLTYIGRATGSVAVLVANASQPFNNVKEMLAYARANPGKLAVATTGLGSTDHLAGELLAYLTSTSYNFVPYKGGAPAIQDVIAGVAQLRNDALASSRPHIDSGKLKLLAVWTEKRVPDLPNVPTVNETVPGASFGGYFGLAAPKGLPKPIVTKLNAELNEVMKMPDVVSRMTSLGLAPDTGTPEYMTKVVKEDHDTWAKLIKEAKLKLEQ